MTDKLTTTTIHTPPGDAPCGGTVFADRVRPSKPKAPTNALPSSADSQTAIDAIRIPVSVNDETVAHIKQAIADDVAWRKQQGKVDFAQQMKSWQLLIDCVFLPSGKDLAHYQPHRNAIATLSMTICHPELRLAMNTAIGSKLTQRREKIGRDRLENDPLAASYIEQLRYINHALITDVVLQYSNMAPNADPAELQRVAEQAFCTSVETWDPSLSKLSGYVMMPMRSALQKETLWAVKHAQKVGSYNAWDTDDRNAIDHLRPRVDRSKDTQFPLTIEPVIFMGMKRAMRLAHMPEEEQAIIRSSLKHPDASVTELARAHKLDTQQVRTTLRKIPVQLAKIFPEFFEALQHHSERPLREEDLQKLLPRIRFSPEEKPRDLKQLGKLIIDKSGDQLAAVCSDMGLYESSIRAMAAGEWLPDAENVKTLCAYMHLPVEREENFNMETRQKLISLRKTSPKHAHFKEVMGVVTTHSTMREITTELLDGTVMEIGQLFHEDGKRYGSNLYQSIQKLVSRKTVLTLSDAYVDDLAGRFHASAQEKQLLQDTNANHLPRLAFTELLENHIDRGRPNLPQFLAEVSHRWNAPLAEIMRQMGNTGTGYAKFNRAHITKKQVIERAVDSLKLTGADAVRFHQLCRGSHAPSAVEEIIDNAQLQLRKSRRDPSIDPEALVRQALHQVVHATGLFQEDLSHTIKNIISNSNKPIDGRKASYDIDGAFAVLLTDDPVSARRLANMSLGIYEEFNAQQLLDAAKRGQIPAYDIIRQDRLFKRQKVEDYGRSVPYTDPKTHVTGLSHPYVSALENGKVGTADRDIANALAKTVGLTGKKDAADFGDMLLGIYKGPGSASDPQSFATRALKGGRGFATHRRQ